MEVVRKAVYGCREMLEYVLNTCTNVLTTSSGTTRPSQPGVTDRLATEVNKKFKEN